MACLVWDQRQETRWQPQGRLRRRRLGQGLSGRTKAAPCRLWISEGLTENLGPQVQQPGWGDGHAWCQGATCWQSHKLQRHFPLESFPCHLKDKGK